MKIQRRTLSILSSMFVAGLLMQAQQSNPQPSAQQPSAQTPDTTQAQPAQSNTVPANTQPAPATTQPVAPATDQSAPTQQPSTQQPTTQPATPGSGVNPSQGPLQPVKPVTSYPDAAGEQQQNAPAQGNNLPNGPQPKRPTEPVGAATAESVPTTGGAAAKPAGVAIAPAKQHQSRSLLIKVGAALAAGAALGTVYALSHGTSPTPPGATLTGVTQK